MLEDDTIVYQQTLYYPSTLDANIHSRAMIAGMIYSNANVPVESLNVKVAHDFEVLRHCLLSIK